MFHSIGKGLKLLSLSYHHSHFLATSFDFTYFFHPGFLGCTLSSQLGCFCIDDNNAIIIIPHFDLFYSGEENHNCQYSNASFAVCYTSCQSYATYLESCYTGQNCSQCSHSDDVRLYCCKLLLLYVLRSIYNKFIPFLTKFSLENVALEIYMFHLLYLIGLHACMNM